MKLKLKILKLVDLLRYYSYIKFSQKSFPFNLFVRYLDKTLLNMEFIIEQGKDVKYRYYVVNPKSHPYLKLILDHTRFHIYSVDHEKEVLSCLEKLLYKGKCFVDVGAYVGYYSIYAASKGCTVISIEPDPRNFSLLLKNIVLNKLKNHIYPLNVALGTSSKTVRLSLNKEPSLTRLDSSPRFKWSLNKHVFIQMKKLDTIVKELGLKSIDVMKIDTEGYGYEVILGGLGSIRKFRPVILFEIHIVDSMDELKAIKILEALGYEHKIISFRNNRNFILLCYNKKLDQ